MRSNGKRISGLLSELKLETAVSSSQFRYTSTEQTRMH